MYPTAAFGLLLLALGLSHAIRPGKRTLALFAILAVVCLTSGGLGVVLGLVATFLDSGNTGASYAATMLGASRALHNLALALGFIVLATLLLAVGNLRAALAAGPEAR